MRSQVRGVINEKKLLSFLQEGAESLGHGSIKAKQFTGHLAKLRGVRLVRLLGCTDLDVRKFEELSRKNAYIRYTEGFFNICG